MRLQAIEDWARLDTRDEQTTRVVLELVREVRRLRAAPAAPVPRDILDGITSDDVYGVYI